MKSFATAVVLFACSLGATRQSFAVDRLVPEQYSTIQAALSASVAGDVISIAAGSYNVGALTMPGFEISLSGRGAPKSTIITGTEILISGGTGVRRFSNITLRGFSGYAAIQVNGATAEVQGVVFENNSSHGIFLNTNAFATTKRCVFSGQPRGGYAYVNSTWNAEDCLFEQNGPCSCYGAGAGFHVGSGGTFVRCQFLGNSNPQGAAVGLSFGGNRVFDNCLFQWTQTSSGPIWWTEFGATGTCKNSTFCGYTRQDISGGFTDGGGNQFLSGGCGLIDCNGDGLVDLGQILRGDLDDFNNNQIPDACELSITGVVPPSIPAQGGSTVTIKGANFPANPTVLIGGVSATDVVRVSATRITATSPALLPGMTSVSVNGFTLPDGIYIRPECGSDLDQNGTVDTADISIILLDFGPCYEPQAALADPAPTPLLADEPAQKPTNR